MVAARVTERGGILIIRLGMLPRPSCIAFSPLPPLPLIILSSRIWFKFTNSYLNMEAVRNKSGPAETASGSALLNTPMNLVGLLSLLANPQSGPRVKATVCP